MERQKRLGTKSTYQRKYCTRRVFRQVNSFLYICKLHLETHFHYFRMGSWLHCGSRVQHVGPDFKISHDFLSIWQPWKSRVTSQFEEGQHFSAHLIQSPKSKTSSPVKVHVQNRRFSLTSGAPPKLVHSWNLNDLRRFGPLEGGRFCFEGGSS